MSKDKIDSWFLGVDLGTGSCKTVVVDEQMRVLGGGTAEYTGNGVQEKLQD
jgi:sugar (pentulose or hexulose) kinase